MKKELKRSYKQDIKELKKLIWAYIRFKWFSEYYKFEIRAASDWVRYHRIVLFEKDFSACQIFTTNSINTSLFDFRIYLSREDVSFSDATFLIIEWKAVNEWHLQNPSYFKS